MQSPNIGLPFSGLTKPLPVAGGRPGTRAWGVFAVAAVWLIVTYVLFNLNASLYQTAILIAILTTLLVPIAILDFRRELDVFESIVFANISLASMFIGRPLFDISANAWNHYSWGTFFSVRPGFDQMLFYAWLGILAFQLGYLSPFAKTITSRLPALRRSLDTDKAVRASLIIFMIGAVLFEEYIRQSGGFGFLAAYLTSRGLGGTTYSYKAASGYLFIGPLFWPPAGLISFAAWLRSRRPAHLLLTVMILTCFFISMLGGIARTFTIQGLLGVLLIVYVARNKRPNPALLLLLAFFLLVYLVYEREARNLGSFEQKELVLEKLTENPVKGVETIWSGEDAAMCDYFSAVLTNIPDRFPFANGSVISDIFLRAYPRFLWPGGKKPDERPVYVFKVLFPSTYYRFSSGAAVSIMGELYEDHGGVEMSIGMFLFGILLAVPKEWLKATDNAIPAQILFVLMPAYTVSLMRGGITTFVEFMAITGLTIAVLVKYAQSDRSVAR